MTQSGDKNISKWIKLYQKRILVIEIPKETIKLPKKLPIFIFLYFCSILVYVYGILYFYFLIFYSVQISWLDQIEKETKK